MTRDATARLFIAAYPSPELVRTMLDALGPLGLPDHRPTPAEQVHLTLLFLGERRVSHLGEILESMRGAAAGIAPFELAPERLVALPPRGRARLVAAEFTAPGPIVELQQRLADRLAADNRRRKAFLPHITLCRFPGMGAQVRIDKSIVGEFPGFEVRQIRLVKSVLHPLGARHEAVETVALDR